MLAAIQSQKFYNNYLNGNIAFGCGYKAARAIESKANMAVELEEEAQKSLHYCLNYFARDYKQNRFVNFEELKNAGIPNLKLIFDKGLRGETLSSPKNDRYLKLIKKCGVDTVIDLRGADYTPKYKEKCDKLDLRYVHFPLDKDKIFDRLILDNMPELFEVLEKGKYYISCAQGLHRTDIALAINYVFNPKQKVPPIMEGHKKGNLVDLADINRRLNSLYKAMTPEDKIKFGWDESYEAEFLRKKRVLRTYNETVQRH